MSFKTDYIPIFRLRIVEVTEVESDARLSSVFMLCKLVSWGFVFLGSQVNLWTG